MRRVATLLGALVALACAGLAVQAASGGAADKAHVDAIFPNAGFLIPGQQVKIAGAVVGSVTDVTLTPDTKARISMEIDKEFAPFKTDADCTIQPQSLIGEKFIDCNPGSADAQPLAARGGRPPTVPIANTHAPVDIDLVLATLRQPTTQRLSLFLDALGGGLTGNGLNLNEAIRRANPALGQTKQLLDEVNGDRQTLQALLRESDRVLATLADRRDDVARFVTGAADATQASADRSTQLRRTLRGLPALLAQTQPSLDTLTALAQDGTPAVRDLRRATPAATRLIQAVRPFATQAEPTLRELGGTARKGLAAIPDALPQLRRLARAADELQPFGRLVGPFLQSTRDKGAVEGILRFLYYATTAQARYDGISHYLAAYPLVKDTCNVYATTTVASCNANFAGGGRTRAARTERKTPAAKAPARTTEQPKADAAPAPQGGSAPERKPLLPALGDQLPATVQQLVDGLLGGERRQGLVPGVVDGLLGGGKDRSSGGDAPSGDEVQGLLNYLLGGGR